MQKEGRLPYYANPDFDWNDKSQWINDQNAVNYWLTHKEPIKYPTDFNSKTY
jgi:hypothetical protein